MSQDEKICPICREISTKTYCYKCDVETKDHSVNTGDEPKLIESMNKSVTKQSQDDLITCPDPKCGKPNESHSLVCIYCGTIIAGNSQSDDPRNEAAENEPISEKTSDKKLMIFVGNQQIDECKDGDVLGREGTVACHIFSETKEVSRRHVSVQVRSGEWWLTNLPSTTNITIVNGRKLPIGDSVRLSEDTTLQMSTKCTVTLRVV